MVIDIHAHLFNLRYLPVAGILRRYTDNKIPVNIALGVEWFLWRKTGSSYPLLTGEEIVNENETGNSIHKLLGITRKEFGPDQLIKMNQHELLDALRQKLNEEDINDTPLAIALDEFNKIDTNLAEPTVHFSNREKTQAFTRGGIPGSI